MHEASVRRLDFSHLHVLVVQEHHLQRAISAQQVYGEKRDNMVIPVPEAESNITYYDSIYPGDFKMPKQLIHIQREWSGGQGAEMMACDGAD